MPGVGIFDLNMKKRIKQIGIAAGLLAALAACLAAAVILYFKTDSGRRLVQDAVNRLIPGTVSVEKINFSVLRGRLELGNFRLKSPSGSDLAGFDGFWAELSWRSLLGGEIRVSKSVLDRPWGRIRVGTRGGVDLVEALVPSGSQTVPPATPDHGRDAAAPPLNLVVASFEMVDGAVDLEMASERTRVILKGIGLAAAADLRGKSGSLKLRIAGGSLETPKIKTRIDGFEIESDLKAGRIDPLLCRLDSQALQMKVSGTISQVLGQPLLDLTLDFGFPVSEALKSSSPSRGSSGRVSGRMTVAGPPGNPDVSLGSNYAGMFAGTRVKRAEAALRLQDRRLFLDSLKVEAASGLLEINGEADLQGALPHGFTGSPGDLDTVSYRLHLDQKGMHVGEIFEAYKSVAGKADSVLTLEGRGVSPRTLRARADLECRAEILSGRTDALGNALHLNASARLENGIAELEKLDAAFGGIRVLAAGSYDLGSASMRSRLELDAPDLSVLPIREYLPNGFDGSAVGGELHLAGVFDGYRGAMSLEAKRLAYEDIRLGDLAANVRLAEGQVFLDRLVLKNRRSDLRASGKVRLFDSGGFKLKKDPVFRFDAQGDALFLGDFSDNLEGNLAVEARIDGSRNRAEGYARVRGRRLDLAGQKLEGFVLDADLEAEKLHIRQLNMETAPGESIAGSGWISLQRAFEFGLTTRGITLDHIEPVKRQNLARGKLSFDVSGRGSVDSPEISGRVVLQNLQVSDRPLHDISLRVDLHDHMLKVAGRPGFDINGWYHLQGKDFSVEAEFTETELAPYFKFGGQDDLKGTLSGKIMAAGNAGAVSRVRGSADISGLGVFHKERKLFETRNFRAAIQDGTLLIPDLNLALAGKGDLRLKGKGSLGGALDFTASGTVPLEVLDYFVEDLADATGNISVDARVRGTVPAPDFRGEVRLEKAGFTLPAVHLKVRDITGRVDISPDAVLVEGIRAKVDSGSVELAGRVGLQSLRPTGWDLTVRADRLPVTVPETLDLLIDADLKLAGSLSKSTVQGDVLLLEGAYYKDVDLSLVQAVGKKQRPPLPPAPGRSSPLLEKTALNVSLKARRPFLVDNNLARLEIRPDLRLTGTASLPVFNGRAVIESGTIEFRKNTFEVKKGVVDFLNPYKIEPVIDVESDVKVRNWTVFLKLSGTPDQLAFQLTSEPPENEGDILSLLLFGKTTKELIEGEGGITQSPGQIMAEMIGETWGKDIKSATGLDIFEIKSGGAGDSAKTRVTLGKELSRRLTVKYAVESKQGVMVQRAITEYKFLEHILVNGFQDTLGVFGGEVKLRIDFR